MSLLILVVFIAYKWIKFREYTGWNVVEVAIKSWLLVRLIDCITVIFPCRTWKNITKEIWLGKNSSSWSHPKHSQPISYCHIFVFYFFLFCLFFAVTEKQRCALLSFTYSNAFSIYFIIFISWIVKEGKKSILYVNFIKMLSFLVWRTPTFLIQCSLYKSFFLSISLPT